MGKQLDILAIYILCQLSLKTIYFGKCLHDMCVGNIYLSCQSLILSAYSMQRIDQQFYTMMMMMIDYVPRGSVGALHRILPN